MRRGRGIARHLRASALTRLRDGQGIWMGARKSFGCAPPRQALKNHAFFEHAEDDLDAADAGPDFGLRRGPDGL